MSFRVRGSNLALGARKDFHQFGHLLTLLIGIATGDGMLDAMGNVIAQHFVLDPAQSSADG